MSADSPGNETSEWGVMKWVTWGAGMLGGGLTALVSALAASGVVDGDSTVLVVLGALAAVCLAIGGAVGKSYIDGRNRVKVAKLGNGSQ